MNNLRNFLDGPVNKNPVPAVSVGIVVYVALFMAAVAFLAPDPSQVPDEEEKPVSAPYIEPEPLFEIKSDPPPLENAVYERNLEVSEADRRCLEANIYYEARNQSLSGMLGVGLVTLNRTEHSRWPDTICEVVNQPWQFSWTMEDYPEYPEPDNPVDEKALEKIKLAVSFLLSGGANYVVHIAQDAHHFHNPSLVEWRYAYAYEELGDVGDHRFYT